MIHSDLREATTYFVPVKLKKDQITGQAMQEIDDLITLLEVNKQILDPNRVMDRIYKRKYKSGAITHEVSWFINGHNHRRAFMNLKQA